MKGNPAVPGGPLTSKPTWRQPWGVPPRRLFFFSGAERPKRPGTNAMNKPLVDVISALIRQVQRPGTKAMNQSTSTRAQQIARAARAFEERRTGRLPQSVNVVLSEDTLVITLQGALSPGETALAQSGPMGAAQVQDYHRQLFHSSADSLRREIKRITGVEVREATVQVEKTTGAVMQALPTGAMVQVFMLARSVPADAWSDSGSDDSP
jgi:uncharacterized protein YbcI